MKTINYKGIELEVHDSTVVQTYTNRGDIGIEFNKPIYRFEGRIFNSLDEVDKYLGKELIIISHNGYDIRRCKPKFLCKADDNKIKPTVLYKIDGDACNGFFTSTKGAIKFIDVKLKPKSQSQNDISNPSSNNDNRLAIKMLNSVSEILSAIESDDAELIELNLTELKERVDKFEKVYYDNKRNGVYE